MQICNPFFSRTKVKPGRFHQLFLFAAAFCLSAQLSGCSFTEKSDLRNELENTGPIALDPSNPFVVGSQFLQAESKHSEILRKFVEFRGPPTSLEVRKKFFGGYKVYLFYLDRKEAYRLDEGSDDWIVRGPESIPAEILSTLKNVTTNPNSAARSALAKDAADNSGQTLAQAAEGDLLEQDTLPPLRASEKNLKNLHPKINDLPPRAVKVEPKNEDTIFDETSAPEADIEVTSEAAIVKPRTGKNKTGAALRQVAPNLQEAASGDLIHTVSFPGETLRIITAWYTGDVNSANRLARINGINNPDKLVIGQTIRIPRYMLANSTPFPEAEIERYNDNLTKH